MKTRFSPSPTGMIHLGNARTALFSALAAFGAENGTFLLRIEDTDSERSEQRFVEQLKTDLRWMGAAWQEGPDVSGEHAPYFQSARQAIYDAYYQQLQDQGQAYPCFCSEAELALSRKIQRSLGQAPRYSGKCRHLSASDIAAKQAEGLQPVLRFCVPDNETIEFDDLVYGAQRFNGADIGDFIIRRANGVTSFMFCNAIDDSLMGVTHALRGDDHLTNTPRQLWILRALGLREPQYGHISLIVGQDGSPLSKRHGSKSIAELRELGFLPLAVVNYLARLGHYYAATDLLTIKQLAAGFDFKQLGRAPAKFDQQQLLHWQKLAMAKASDAEIWASIKPDTKALIPAHQQDTFLQAVKPNMVFPTDADAWAEILMGEQLTLDDEALKQLHVVDSEFFIKASDLWQADTKAWLNAVKSATGVKGKQLFQPIRLALTGQLHGPELPLICDLLGEARIKQRLQHLTK